jgi:hypothetical protein
MMGGHIETSISLLPNKELPISTTPSTLSTPTHSHLRGTYRNLTACWQDAPRNSGVDATPAVPRRLQDGC